MSTKPPAPPKTVPRYLDLAALFPQGGTMAKPKSAKFRDTSGVLEAALILMNANTQKHQPAGRFDRVVLHWTAGGPLMPYDDYHYCQVMDTDDIPAMVRCVPEGAKGQHLQGRNTGACGFSYCAAGPGSIGAIRIEQMAKAIAEFCHKQGLDPAGKTHDGFWVIGDHAMYAAVDYPGARWDVGSQLPDIAPGKPDPRNIWVITRKKAIWYHQHIVVIDGVAQYEFGPILYKKAA